MGHHIQSGGDTMITALLLAPTCIFILAVIVFIITLNPLFALKMFLAVFMAVTFTLGVSRL
jgi:hypothetical protein